MTTSNLEPLPVIPKDILPPGSTAASQLGFSVVNISDITLNKDQISALEKGLTFCPAPGAPDITNIWNELEEFLRRLRIKRYFDESLEDSERSPFRVKSTWTAPEGQDNLLDTFIKTVKLDLLLRDPKLTKKSNLSTKQFNGLKALSENPHIVI